ncbi:MAG: fibronectin type III domain-containing protein [Flavobacterium sp.]|nr:fibronectin type III domain-containing protein [Flavobacterium sp.]
MLQFSICNEPTQLYYDGLTSTTNNIAWVAPNPAPSNGYVYCYSTVNDPFSANAIIGTTTDTYANLTNLTPNTTYFFWVKSICDNTQTDWASGGSFTTYPESGCDTPTQLFTDPESATVVNIAWIAPTNAPSNGYIYSYSTVNDLTSPNAITGTTTDTFAVLNNLTPNTTYYFWVKSICGNTQTDWVSGGSFTTQMLTSGSFSINNLKLYPNPVKDVLNLSFDKEINTISIYNLLGQEVQTKIINANEGSIDTSNLAPGTYLVKIISDDLVKTAKIVKK